MKALVVTVSSVDVDLASDALWSLGVVAVEERGVGDAVELWTSLGDEFEPDALAWPWRFEVVDETLADGWRQFAKPVEVVPGLIVKPAWVASKVAAGTTVVSIEPGATFGAGDHPTTVLCLRAIDRLAGDSTVLDVGCGSGVLAVTAKVLGADRVVAIDIAPAAVPVTSANAAANGVEVEVSNRPLSAIDGVYDLVLANILAPVLIDLADDLRRVVAPTGTLVISGILAEPDRHRHVLAALAPLVVDRTDVLDGWAAITLCHTGKRS